MMSSARPRSSVVLALLATVALASSACSVFGSDSPTPASATQPDGGAADADGPKAPPVGGPAAQSELTDALGIFVAETGQDSADGTHDRPLATIQAGIDHAKLVGKRVYVCVGTYKEALVLADSISIVAGLDCTNYDWRVGTGVSRVESPTSPAVRAKDIASSTRLEGLDLVAPSAKTPGGSSIGLVAERAAALVIARSKITAGDAVKGDDGTEGPQLSNAATTKGAAGAISNACVETGSGFTLSRTCTGSLNFGWHPTPGGSPGTNACVGVPAIVADPGGAGGTGGMWIAATANLPLPHTVFTPQTPAEAAQDAPAGKTGALGTDAADGAIAEATGAFSSDGYAPADGAAGKNGAAGSGGSGGNGSPPSVFAATAGSNWSGWGGAGGGAGGCPGLAGTAGKGGGASIAALLIDSPLTFDTTELVSGLGGTGGSGSLGSTPSPGGAGGDLPAGSNASPAQAGGRGGAAGVSTNGGSGPSIGIAHRGAAPTVLGATKVTPGAGGGAIAARVRTDGLGITKTIPATPAGVSKDILPL